jgi:serine/threonine protein kinase
MASPPPSISLPKRVQPTVTQLQAVSGGAPVVSFGRRADRGSGSPSKDSDSEAAGPAPSARPQLAPTSAPTVPSPPRMGALLSSPVPAHGSGGGGGGGEARGSLGLVFGADDDEEEEGASERDVNAQHEASEARRAEEMALAIAKARAKGRGRAEDAAAPAKKGPALQLLPAAPPAAAAGGYGSAVERMYENAMPLDNHAAEGADPAESGAFQPPTVDVASPPLAAFGAAVSSPWQFSAAGELHVGRLATLTERGVQWATLTEGGAQPPDQQLRAGAGIKSELIEIHELGRGSSASVTLALHVPTLQLVALKSIRFFDAEMRSQVAAELRTMHGNILPLVLVPSAKAAAKDAAALGAARVGPGNTLSSPLSASASFNFTGTMSSFALTGGLSGSLGAAGGGSGGSFSSESGGAGGAEELGGGVAAAPPSHVVRMFSAYLSSDSTVSLVLEYCGGGTLEDVMRAGGVRDERCIARLAAHGARGLAALHRSKQMHRDVKPGNLLLTVGGKALKLADLGITKQLEGSAAFSTTFVGTMAYMAPERLDIEGSGSSASASSSSAPLAAVGPPSATANSFTGGARGGGGDEAGGVSGGATSAASLRAVGGGGGGGGGSGSGGYGLKSDVWALGMSLLAAIVGREPFSSAVRAGAAAGGFSGGGAGFWELIRAIRDEEPPLQLVGEAFSADPDGTPPSHELLSFLGACLVKSPAERHSAEQLLQHPFLLRHAKAAASTPTTGEMAARTGAAPQFDMHDCEVGLPLSDCARPAALAAAFPGEFHVLGAAAQAKRAALVRSVVGRVARDGEAWATFKHFFTRYVKNGRGLPRKKEHFPLHETATNPVALTRAISLSASMSASNLAALARSPGGDAGAGGAPTPMDGFRAGDAHVVLPALPRSNYSPQPRALPAGASAFSAAAGDSSGEAPQPAKAAPLKLNVLKELASGVRVVGSGGSGSGGGGGGASSGGSGGGLDGGAAAARLSARAEPPAFPVLQLTATDVWGLAEQLEYPPIVLLADFNDAIRARCGADGEAYRAAKAADAAARASKLEAARRSVEAPPSAVGAIAAAPAPQGGLKLVASAAAGLSREAPKFPSPFHRQPAPGPAEAGKSPPGAPPAKPQLSLARAKQGP